jgi:adenylyltransferase/sulfurtransferase
MAVNNFLTANLAAIGEDGQQAISNSTFLVAGLGGVGGIAFDLLLRAGAGKVKAADSGFFEKSNANRQLLWSLRMNGKRKETAALFHSKGLGRSQQAKLLGKITPKNADSMVRGCTAAICALDSRESRQIVVHACRKAGIPCVFSSATKACGFVTVILPVSPSVSHIFSKQGAAKHAFGPVANLVGCIAAQQSLNIALEKPIVAFPRAISIDAFSEKPFTTFEF